MARVALTLLAGERARNPHVVAAVLPQRDASLHRAHVLVAHVLQERARRVRGAVAGRAVEDHGRGAVWNGALDARLQVAAGDVLGARNVPARELLRLAHVNDGDTLVDQLGHLRGVDLLDLALDRVQQLRTRGTHQKTPKRHSGFINFTKYSAGKARGGDTKPGWAPPLRSRMTRSSGSWFSVAGIMSEDYGASSAGS